MEYIKFEKEENLPNLDTALYSDREPYVNEEIEIGISIEKKPCEVVIMNRELDGYYFRVNRNGKWQNICFSDLTEDEMQNVLKDRDISFCKSLCIGLGKTIRNIGDTLNLSCGEK